MNINLTAPINSLGYGNVGVNIMRALDAAGVCVSWWPIGQPEPNVVNENVELIERCFKNRVSYDQDAPSIRIWHQFDLAQHIGKGPRFGFPIFELDKFNDVELHHLKNQDALFVCSEWAKEVIKENGIETPTYVIPLGVDRNTFTVDEKAKEHELCRDNPTVFVNIGKWEYRKGHDVIPLVLEQALGIDENYLLIMMNSNPFIKEEQTKEWESFYRNKLGDHVRFVERVDTASEVAYIMNMADCGIFPSRAEGWNLELLEMMACGKHVIATNYSAHKDFCNNENCMLVEVDSLEPAFDGVFFNDEDFDGRWGVTDSYKQIDQMVDYVKEIHKMKQDGSLGINVAGLKTAEQFSWNNSAKKIIDCVF